MITIVIFGWSILQFHLQLELKQCQEFKISSISLRLEHTTQQDVF